MKWIFHLIGAVLANGAGLFIASKFVGGVELTANFNEFAVVTLIFTGLNFVVKPLLKLFLGPIIILTLGLGLIVVNALVLYLLDILSPGLMIQGVSSLIIASFIIGVINFIFHLIFK